MTKCGMSSDTHQLLSEMAATKETGPDIIVLIDSLLRLSSRVNVHVYSELDDKNFLIAWWQFDFADTCALSETMTTTKLARIPKNYQLAGTHEKVNTARRYT